jgi:hypothetical protein
VTRNRRVAVASPQTRLYMSRRRGGVRAAVPHLAPADLERARRTHRLQLRRAAATLALLALLIIGLPAVLDAFPALDGVRVAGVPVGWIAVGVLPYAFLVGLATWQLRRAEQAEES